MHMCGSGENAVAAVAVAAPAVPNPLLLLLLLLARPVPWRAAAALQRDHPGVPVRAGATTRQDDGTHGVLCTVAAAAAAVRC
jgi:alpha-beta hydrolase superfamily lysophospholipase